MILQIPTDRFSSSMMKAILDTEKTLSAFESPDQLVIAGECVLGILRDLRKVGEQDPDRRAHFGAICSDVQTWLRQGIEALRFTKSH